MRARDRLIVALDTEPGTSYELARSLRDHVGWLKVGMTLFYQTGPVIVSELRDMGFEVFLDLKLHDIPHQVEGAAHSVAGLGAGMLTVHCSGGQKMIEAAVRGAAQGAALSRRQPPKILGVTVLTSLGEPDLVELGFAGGPGEQVLRLAGVASDAGADGVVCSPLEAAPVRELLGADPLVVTPGVRPVGSDAGDQSRTSTPADALRSGASHIVVGRPITEAEDPAAAADQIIAQMEEE